MNPALDQYSLYATYSAMAVLTLAMVGYVFYLAGLRPQRGRDEAEVHEPVLVAAGASEATLPATSHLAVGSDSPHQLNDEAGPSLRARKAAGIAGMLTNLAALLLLAATVLRGLSVHRWPLGNMFEFALMASAIVTIAFALWSTRRDLRWLGFFVVAPVLLILGLAVTIWYAAATHLVPSLQSYWLVIHVTIATVSVAVFGIAAAITALYLWRDHAERSQSGPAFLLRFPDAKALERLSYSLHIVAFPLWSFTLIAGAIWARQAWGAYWNWDPKEVWTFVIWVVYAAYLHARATSGWRRQNAALIALAGFACILINYGIVNVFFVGQHSYSGL